MVPKGCPRPKLREGIPIEYSYGCQRIAIEHFYGTKGLPPQVTDPVEGIPIKYSYGCQCIPIEHFYGWQSCPPPEVMDPMEGIPITYSYGAEGWAFRWYHRNTL